MDELFIDFNKRDFRWTYPIAAAFLGISGISQLLVPANKTPIPAAVLEIVVALVVVVLWQFPMKWYFKVDSSGIEYKRHLCCLRRFDWSAVQRIDLPPDKISIMLADGGSAHIHFLFMLQKERLAIRSAVTKFASERDLLSGI